MTLGGFSKDKCQLSDVQTRLSIRKGVIEKSLATGVFAGLKGTIDLDGHSQSGEVIKLNFKGPTLGLTSLASDAMREKLNKEFSHEIFSLNAGMRATDSGLKVEGTFNVKGEKERSGQTIEFGFDMERSSSQLWNKWPAHHLTSTYIENIGLEASMVSMPAIASPTTFLKAQWMKRELGIAGFVIRDGWFQAQNLPLEKYIAPLLFPEVNIKLLGNGDLQGSFDHSSLSVNYDIRNMLMENDDCHRVESFARNV